MARLVLSRTRDTKESARTAPRGLRCRQTRGVYINTGQRRSDQRVGRLSLHVRRGHPLRQSSVRGDAVPEEHVVVIEVGGK